MNNRMCVCVCASLSGLLHVVAACSCGTDSNCINNDLVISIWITFINVAL